MSEFPLLLRKGKFYNQQHEKSDLHLQAADRIEELEAALKLALPFVQETSNSELI